MGTVIKSTSSKNIGLKISWGGERYKGQTISIVNRKNKFNKILKSGKPKHPYEDIFIDDALRINRHQTKFLIKILRTKLVRKKLADDLEKWVKGKEEPDYSVEWLG
tara:strand:+ start:1012 stop:1329 length:318 start_codon:yes stop_codon:yes gene_type:complete